MTKRHLEIIDMVVIHGTATPPNMDIGWREIDRYHRGPKRLPTGRWWWNQQLFDERPDTDLPDGRGWLMGGYHEVIRRDGSWEQGRPIEMVGAHAFGFNDESVGIVLVGGVDEQGIPACNYTPAQMDRLWLRLAEHTRRFGVGLQVKGHRELPGVAKACPSFDVQHWLRTRELRNPTGEEAA